MHSTITALSWTSSWFSSAVYGYREHRINWFGWLIEFWFQTNATWTFLEQICIKITLLFCGKFGYLKISFSELCVNNLRWINWWNWWFEDENDLDTFTILTLKVLNFWTFIETWSGWICDSYCSLKPLCSGMGEVVPARTSPTLLPPILSHCAVIMLFQSVAVHQLSRLAL